MFGSFSRASGRQAKVYSGQGADIVMQSLESILTGTAFTGTWRDFCHNVRVADDSAVMRAVARPKRPGCIANGST
jgi:hypothetical protein